MLWQIIIVLCILWYLLELWKIRRVVAASRQIKSSFISLPLIGHSYMFIGSNEDRMTAIKKVSYDAMKNASNVSNIRMAFEFYTVVVDAEAIDILSKEFLNKPPMLYRFSRKLLGDGSLMAPLNIWRPRRKLLAPMFGQKNLLNFVKEFSKQSMILAQNLQSVAGGEAFSVWPFFTTYTLDTVCETALGIQLDKQIQKHEEFREAFEEYTVIGSRRMLKPWLYPGAIYRLHPDCKKLKKYGATVNQFITDVVEKKRLSMQEKRQTDSEQTNYNILEMLLQTADTSTKMLIEEMLVLVLAATDTSAVGASFTAVMLSKYPEVQKKVYEEIRTVIGEKNRPIEVSDLAHLKYLEAVIKETLRLYPPVPIVARAVHKDITLPSGVTLVKGSNLILSVWGAHRNPEYWGEDAEEFNPGRFIKGNYTQSAFIPFSCGPRGCLGYKYAMMSLKTMIATLIMHYEILQAPNLYTGPIRVQYNIMMKDVDNFQIKLKLR